LIIPFTSFLPQLRLKLFQRFDEHHFVPSAGGCDRIAGSASKRYAGTYCRELTGPGPDGTPRKTAGSGTDNGSSGTARTLICGECGAASKRQGERQDKNTMHG